MCFGVVLSHSRKGYSEVVWQQSTENFIRWPGKRRPCLRGVPQTIVIDNLRAAVTQADWFDPQLNPKIIAFAEHYRTVIFAHQAVHAPAQGQSGSRRQIRSEQRASRADVRQPGRAKPVFGGVGKRRGPIHAFMAPPASRWGRIFATVGATAVDRAAGHRSSRSFRKALRHVHLDGTSRWPGRITLCRPEYCPAASVGAVGFAAGAHLQLAYGTNRLCTPGSNPGGSAPIPNTFIRANAPPLKTGWIISWTGAADRPALRPVGGDDGQKSRPQGIRVLQGFLQTGPQTRSCQTSKPPVSWPRPTACGTCTNCAASWQRRFNRTSSSSFSSTAHP